MAITDPPGLYNRPTYATSPQRFDDLASMAQQMSEQLNTIAQQVASLVMVVRQHCYVQERNSQTLADGFGKQTELITKLVTDTQVAVLKAARWEEIAVRLQVEVNELRRG